MKKVITTIVLLAVVAFMLYNIIGLFTSAESSVIAQMDVLEVSYDFEGIVTRNEYNVKADIEEDGVLDPAVAENEMVKKGKTVAVYYDSTIDDETKKKLAEINRKIDEINASPSEEKTVSEDPEKLGEQISKTTKTIIETAPTRDMAAVSSLRSELSTILGRKLISEGEAETVAESLAQLSGQKRRLEKEYGGKKVEIISPSHGIFSTKVDGYETVLTEKKALSMTVSDFETAKKKDVSSKDATSKGVVCKIIDNSKWWVSVLSDEQSAKAFEVGKSVTLEFGGEAKGVRATVEYISPASGGKYIITFSSIAYSDHVINNRFVTVKAITASYSGLRIPLEAIRVKDGKPGVYVQTENTIAYREVDVLYKDDETAIVSVDNTKSNSLLLYDEVIINKKNG